MLLHGHRLQKDCVERIFSGGPSLGHMTHREILRHRTRLYLWIGEPRRRLLHSLGKVIEQIKDELKAVSFPCALRYTE
jgi:hypothetical protein